MAVSVARSDVGRKRTINEDSYVADDQLGLFLVADGMGGHAGGEVASGIAADALQNFVRSSSADTEITWPFGYSPALTIEANQLRNAIQLANQLIVNRAASDATLQTMGSTLVVCIVRRHGLVFGNIGDSRLYLWRGGVLQQVSEDDSWAASMLRAGASAEMVSRHEMRHVLTRALGTAQPLDVSIREQALEPGDVLLLCSDGLYGPLGETAMAAVLAREDLDMAGRADALIAGANAAGGPDNITVVLVTYDGIESLELARPVLGQSPWTGRMDNAEAEPVTLTGVPAPSTSEPEPATLVGVVVPDVSDAAPADGVADRPAEGQ